MHDWRLSRHEDNEQIARLIRVMFPKPPVIALTCGGAPGVTLKSDQVTHQIHLVVKELRPGLDDVVELPEQLEADRAE
jgi:hypothetical protein